MARTSAIHRRQFIGHAGGTALALLAARTCPAAAVDGEFLFLEAEAFADQGGWDLDQQSMDQMGSPYLLAHGLGVPVRDAVCDVEFPSAGTYRVWVRTRDWVAPWNAPGAPGKFQLVVDGEPLPEIFGTRGADWHWHDGGTVAVGARATLALHDLTGFEGRCEAILFCKDAAFEPTSDVAALTQFRRRLLGLPKDPDEGGAYDLVVVGGGLAGTCAALSAARHGLSVALVQDRPVLGGNGSSEVRVWPQGHTNQPPYPHVGDIVSEIVRPLNTPKIRNGAPADVFDDALKLRVVAAEPRIKLFINHRAMEVSTDGNRIAAVVAQSTRTGRQVRLSGRLFADCTGDAKIGHLAGADYEFAVGGNMGSTNLWRPLDAADHDAVLRCECKDKDALTATCERGAVEQPFPRCPWAIDLSGKPFPGREKFREKGARPAGLEQLGGWFWESGFDKDPIEDIERIRDLNFRAMYGAWDALKNVDGLYPNHRIGWAAFIAGKRESRRLLGDVVLDASDFLEGRTFPDGAFPCSWGVDVHTPHKNYDKDFAGEEFIATFTHGKGYTYKGPYWAPYRCLYSRNISNLFMAGRNISVTKHGLGPVRVMKTCGMMGEIVGKAAAVCIRRQVSPRDVYHRHWPEMQQLMEQPGAERTA